MLNQTIQIIDDLSKEVLFAVSYIPILIIVLGLFGNITAFVIFTFNKSMKLLSSMKFLSFISITDTLALFIWNLNHFLIPNFNIEIEFVNLFTCKFFGFLQYFSLQCSGTLHSLISVDRYFTIISKPGSFVSRLPFGSPRSATLWSIGVLVVIGLLNAHILIFSGIYKTVNVTQHHNYYNQNGTYIGTNDTVNSKEKLFCYQTEFYKITPMWDHANMVVYNFLPFVIMSVFNTLLIIKTLDIGKASQQNQNTKMIKKRNRLTVSLVIITFVFIILTLPATILFGFFLSKLRYNAIGHAILIIFDSLMFLQHSSIFFISFLTNYKFRKIVTDNFKIICCRRSSSAKDVTLEGTLTNIAVAKKSSF